VIVYGQQQQLPGQPVGNYLTFFNLPRPATAATATTTTTATA